MKLDELENVLKDLKTYKLMQKNTNYKNRLFEAYRALKNNGIKNKKEYMNKEVGIGAFTYTELTIFDRLKKDEDYRDLLEAYSLELDSIEDYAEDYGDQLASWGTIGKTPYKEKYIEEGLIEEDK